MNAFYFFVSSNYNSESVIALVGVLRKRDQILTKVIDLNTCDLEERNLANYLDIQSTPSLVVLNKSNEKLESVFGPYEIFSKIDFLFSKYGM